MPTPDEIHFDIVGRAILDGDVVPFLGAGANLCDREDGAVWSPGQGLPSGAELARYLAEHRSYPVGEREADLLRVSQFVAVRWGDKTLYNDLHSLFGGTYQPNSLHRFLARLAKSHGGQRHLLVITTNYDDALEHAFEQEGLSYDLVWYQAQAQSDFRGKFVHRSPDGRSVPILTGTDYTDVSLEERAVILKVHGAVDRSIATGDGDSYVITEDHYLDYLTRSDIRLEIPKVLQAEMSTSHFLFLGYSLRDWNLRVLLSRIWGDQRLRDVHWAVQRDPDAIDSRLWMRRGDVEIIDARLNDYIARVHEEVLRLSGVGAPA